MEVYFFYLNCVCNNYFPRLKKGCNWKYVPTTKSLININWPSLRVGTLLIYLPIFLYITINVCLLIQLHHAFIYCFSNKNIILNYKQLHTSWNDIAVQKGTWIYIYVYLCMNSTSWNLWYESDCMTDAIEFERWGIRYLFQKSKWQNLTQKRYLNMWRIQWII